MLIQCQTCATRYRVDLERLPRRKTFVRCKTCGTPIYLDPTSEGDAAEPGTLGVISGAAGISLGDAGASSEGLSTHGPGSTSAGYVPSSGFGFSESDGLAGAGPSATPPGAMHAAPTQPQAVAASPEGVPIQCPHCQSRYRVPAAPLQRPNIKLKCSVCGHIFAPVQPATGVVPQERMDTLFDGLMPPGPGPAGARLTDSELSRLQAHTPSQPFPPSAEADPELAYLDAVALDADEIPRPTGKKVPEAQKYQLFLKPDAFRAQRDAEHPTTPEPTAEPPFAAAVAPRSEVAPSPTKAVWPEHGGDDDFLEIEFFDDDQSSPSYITPLGSTPRPEPALSPEEPTRGGEAGFEDFELADHPTQRTSAGLGAVAKEAAVLGALDLPPLDDEEGFPTMEESVTESAAPDLTDLESLQPPESSPLAETQALESQAAEGALPDIELDGDTLTGTSTGELPPLEEAEGTGAAAQAAASEDSLRLDREVDAADLPLDDIGLDLGLDEAKPTSAAVSGEGEDSFDFGPLSEDPLSGGGAVPPEEELGPLPPLDDVPELDLAAAASTAPGESEGPPVPMMVPEAARSKRGAEPPKRTIIAGQSGWLTDRKRVLALVVVAGVLVGAMIAWAGWLMRDPTSRPFAFEFGKVHQLALQEDLQGRYVTNRSGQLMFVVEGQLVNRFPSGTKISWIRVRGTAYADHAQSRVLGTTQAYLGNVLTQQQLETWEPKAIAAFGAYNNGRNNVNLDIPTSEVVPFQLVFLDIKVPVARTVAQVTGYTRNGLAVYVDAPVNSGK